MYHSLRIRTVDELSDWVSEIEDDRKGIPELLKHYLRLGGRVVAFNVDPLFSNVLDALVLVDLTEADPRILDRFMGRQQATAFLDLHQRLLSGSAIPPGPKDPGVDLSRKAV
jgi:hypothetical protein